MAAAADAADAADAAQAADTADAADEAGGPDATSDMAATADAWKTAEAWRPDKIVRKGHSNFGMTRSSGFGGPVISASSTATRDFFRAARRGEWSEEPGKTHSPQNEEKGAPESGFAEEAPAEKPDEPDGEVAEVPEETAEAGAEEAAEEPAKTKRASPSPKRRSSIHARWDGKASTATMREWRESKYGLEAAFARTLHKSPGFTMRPLNKTWGPVKVSSEPELFLRSDKSVNYLHRNYPSPTIGFGVKGGQYMRESDLAPGPIYAIPSPIDSTPHPLYKNVPKWNFGTEKVPSVDTKAPPGPGAYSQDNFRNDSRRLHKKCYSFRGRMKDTDHLPVDLGRAVRQTSPSPGKYFDHLKEIPRAQGAYHATSWTIPHARDRTDRKTKDNVNPGCGPGAYEVDGVVKSGVISKTRWSMQGSNPGVWKRAKSLSVGPSPD